MKSREVRDCYEAFPVSLFAFERCYFWNKRNGSLLREDTKYIALKGNILHPQILLNHSWNMWSRAAIECHPSCWSTKFASLRCSWFLGKYSRLIKDFIIAMTLRWLFRPISGSKLHQSPITMRITGSKIWRTFGIHQGGSFFPKPVSIHDPLFIIRNSTIDCVSQQHHRTRSHVQHTLIFDQFMVS